MNDPNLLHRAVATCGHVGDSCIHDEGVIVAFCDAPTYTIRRPDGTQFTWRCDLTEVGDRIDPEDLPERGDWQEAQR